MKYFIYQIQNKINNKIYIGVSNNPEYRWKAHIYGKDNTVIQKALKKYGKDNFIFLIIDFAISWESACQKEKYFIKRKNCKVRNGYNMTDGGDGSGGCYPTKETLIKMSMAQTGRKHSKKTKLKIGILHKGIKLSEEHKQKLSDAHKGKKLSDIHKKNIRLSGIDRITNEETKKKISNSLKGHGFSKECLKKMSKAKIGSVPWNKGKKCPQLSGKNNGSYKSENHIS